MPVMPDRLRTHLAKTKLVVLPEDYFVISLRPDAKPLGAEWYRAATTRFALFMREAKQITLVVPRRKWLRMQNLFSPREVSGPMKILAFDAALSRDICGYMAAIGSVLMKAQLCAVPIFPSARDHILVDKKDLPRTVKVLRKFIEDCKKKKI